MHSALTLLAMGSMGNMEMLVIAILAAIVMGVPLLAVLLLAIVARTKNLKPTAKPPVLPPNEDSNPEPAEKTP